MAATGEVVKRYLSNCFWLMVPVLIINFLLGKQLPPVLAPEVFWSDIPWWISWPENRLRMGVMVLPALMPLRLTSSRQQVGAGLYALGIAAYAGSWIALVSDPTSQWSQSVIGLAAPAIIPAVWLAGIGLAGNTYFPLIRLPSWLFPVVAGGFLVAHNAHTFLVLTVR